MYFTQAASFNPFSIIPGWRDKMDKIVAHNCCTGDLKNMTRFSNSSSLNSRTALCLNCKMNSRKDKPENSNYLSDGLKTF